MISNLALVIFIAILVSVVAFAFWVFRTKRKRELLSKLFLGFAVAYGSWILPLVVMYFVDATDKSLMFILDCAMQPGGAMCAPLYLCIAISFVKGYDSWKKWMSWLFVVPIITVLMACTNPWHHLYYVQFSVIKSQIVFGPYLLVSGAYNYICLMGAMIYMIQFGFKNRTPLYLKQCFFFSLSGFVPLVISLIATFGNVDLPITATPLSFLATAICNAMAIYGLHVLDISPVATRHILDAISDSYVVLNDAGYVVTYNRRFGELFAKEYGIEEGTQLGENMKRSKSGAKNVIFRLMAALESSKQGKTHISYEQSITINDCGETNAYYFVVDISPLEVNGQISGYVILFKDITRLRESMKRLQASQERMVEQERFAFLGQMIGGLAHNLKTPIMSISGCVSAADALVEECEDSLEDPEVTPEDYREIYVEMKDWLSKIKESTAYMSDIITAIKGQATNISTTDEVTFTIDEMIKRSTLLMRHELLNGGCRLEVRYDKREEISLQGDINNLVQVIGNLLSNAIFAQKDKGGVIEVQVDHDEEHLRIQVKDNGTGIPDHVLQKLFKSMVTSKGTQGTGLGLYISNAVIRTKFNGEMWCENREGGGSIFGIRIPLENVHIRPADISEGRNK